MPDKCHVLFEWPQAVVITFVGKSLSWNVVEIDTYSQVHQYLMSGFCADTLLPKNYKARLEVEKSYEKQFRKKKVLLKCYWNWHLHCKVENADWEDEKRDDSGQQSCSPLAHQSFHVS